MDRKYSQIIAILFFIFFATPIFSPEFHGSTIYIHLFIPLLDISFLKYIITTKINKKWIIGFGIFAIVSIFMMQIKLLIEAILIIEIVLYLIYCKKKKFFKYLYWGVNFNIIIAIAQFILYYISPDLARIIGPGNIAKMIWGEHATLTFTNIFPNSLGIVRVSGWSREAGFFNSLIIITFIVYRYIDKGNKKWQYILFIIAFAISLSKVSLLAIIIIPIIKLRKYINKIPYILGIGIIIVAGIGTSEFLKQHNQYDNRYTDNYETFTHRFSGYSIMKELSINDLLFGIPDLESLPSNVKENNAFLRYIYRFNEFCGVPAMIIHNSLIVFIAFMLALKMFGYKTADLFIITLLTMTVNYTTQTSFVLLGYYLIAKLLSDDKKVHILGEKNENIVN